MTTILFNPTSSQITAAGVATASAGALAFLTAGYEIPGIRTITKMFEKTVKSVSATVAFPEVACGLTLGASVAAMAGSNDHTGVKAMLGAIGVMGAANAVFKEWLSDAATGAETAIFAGLGLAGLTFIEKSLQK